MKSGMQPTQLPAELWARVFTFLQKERDILDLWASCRPLCKEIKNQVELLFREKHLPRTSIQFDLGSCPPTDGGLVRFQLDSDFEFSHLSEDNSTAFFTSDLDPSFEYRDIFTERVRKYVENINGEDNILEPKHTVSVRRMMNDTAIPKLSINYETLELSCDWREMYSALFYEESEVNDLQSRWVASKDGAGEQVKAKIARGEMSMEEAILWAVQAFGTQHDENVKEARHARILRQIKSCDASSSSSRDLESNEKYQRGIETLMKKREFVEDSSDDDEEETEEEDGDDEEDEWEDEDEEDGDDSEEDEATAA